MSAYRDVFAVSSESSENRFALAAGILARAEGAVLFENSVVLRTQGNRLRCEVIDPDPAARRCEHEYAVQVENACRSLDASGLAPRLPNLPRVWLVVEDRETGVTELWRVP